MDKPNSASRQGVRSVEIGARLLAALAEATGPTPLKALAASAGMAPAKAHRYLVSLGRAGLVVQDEGGRYDLGSAALSIGLAALGRLDIIRLAGPALPRLRDDIDETVVLAVWGNKGPVVIRLVESTHPVTMNIRVGSVIPVLRSAIGRTFLAYLPPKVAQAAVAAEIRSLPGADRRHWTKSRIDALAREVRARGLGRVEGELLQGVAVLAAPVFDIEGGIVAVLAALGRQAAFDAAWDGRVAKPLKAAAARISCELGYASRNGHSGALTP
jgi:DNA-binding IclR family transcriptional regulator